MYLFILFGILVASFILRIINLNYNSPFSDEATYIIIGKLGVFQFDWSSYSPSVWLAGNPYIYPTMTAISYSIFGITGSRFLNIVFGVLTVEVSFALTSLLSIFKNSNRLVAGLIAATIIGGSSTAYFVSRLATYDIPSFYFFFLSIYFLILAQKSKNNIGKWYFLSVILLFLSISTKIITGLYLPFIFSYSYFEARKNKNLIFFWKRYYLFTFLVISILYLIINGNNNISYLNQQISREDVSLYKIIESFWNESFLIWFFWIFGAFGMALKKEWKKLVILTSAGLLIILSHLFSHRFVTLEKHIFISIFFLSLVIGLGLSNLYSYLISGLKRKIFLPITIILLLAFWFISYTNGQKYNSKWVNNNSLTQFLIPKVNPGDKILTENGSSTILALYEKNFPLNITTFDWFKYGKKNGDLAYANAVSDGYFKFIELQDEKSDKNANFIRIHNIIKQKIGTNYQLIFNQDHSLLYKRLY